MSLHDPMSSALPMARPVTVPPFAALYREHLRFVWRAARSLGVPAYRLEDAVQDIFVVVHRRLPEYDGQAPIRAWLFEIARRVAHDHRRVARRKEGNEPLADEARPSTRPGPAREAEVSEDLRLVESILDSMDEDRRVVFVLAEIEQMTAVEIAEALRINLNTVYSRLRRAREAFHSAVTLARGQAQ